MVNKSAVKTYLTQPMPRLDQLYNNYPSSLINLKKKGKIFFYPFKTMSIERTQKSLPIKQVNFSTTKAKHPSRPSLSGSPLTNTDILRVSLDKEMVLSFPNSLRKC